jgi:hypothetical protein
MEGMTKSDSIKELAAALVAAQSELGRVAFDSTNPFLHNEYTSLGALIDASRETLARHGLAIVQLPTSDGDRMAVETMILHRSGEFISEAVSIPFGVERGLSLAQVAGSICTYLRRYSYAGALRLYGDKDTDGGAPTPPRPPSAPKKATPAPKPAATPAPEAPKAKPAPVGRTATPDQRARFLKLLAPVSDAACVFFGADELDQIAEIDIPTTKKEADEIMARIQKLMDEGEQPKPSGGWRSFVLPFGKMKGKTLGDIAHEDSKYLFGLSMRFEVETEYNGKPKRKETIEKDQALRRALDECKAELFDQPVQ